MNISSHTQIQTGRPSFGGRQRRGRRPGLVIVDLCCGFTEPGAPLDCEVGDAVESARQLLDAARSSGALRVFTRIAYDEPGLDMAQAWVEKVPALTTLATDSRWAELDVALGRLPDEPVITKQFVSAFFGTCLATLLTRHRCDAVVLAGASTSGCVRATAVDAMQYGYRTMVVEDAVADRDERAHAAALADISTKYGEVVRLEEAMGYLASTESSLRPPAEP